MYNYTTKANCGCHNLKKLLSPVIFGSMTIKQKKLWLVFAAYMALAYLVLGAGSPDGLASYSVILNLILLLLFGIPMLLARYQLDMVLVFIPFFVLVLQGLRRETFKAGYAIALIVFTLLVPLNIYKSFQLHRLNYEESTQLLIGTKELQLTDNDSNNFDNYKDFTLRSISKYISGEGSRKARKTLKHYHPEWALKIIPLLMFDAIIFVGLFVVLVKNRGRLRFTFL